MDKKKMLATYDDTICNESQMFEQADSRLYEDKRRNESVVGIIMGNTIERRREKRLRYNWPVWYAGKENIDETVLPARMVNVSSGGAAFTCSSEENCPHLDQLLTTHFSVPHSCPDGSFEIEGITRVGKICRIDRVDNELRRIAIQFVEPLPFKPGEQESK